MMIMVCGIQRLYRIDLWVDECAWGETLFAWCWNCLLPLFASITQAKVAQSITQLLHSIGHLGLIIKEHTKPKFSFLSLISQQSPAVHTRHPTFTFPD